jgi:thiamine-phosphate pyrophosphorylase
MMATGEPHCRLYLTLPPLLSGEVRAAFEQTIASVDVACVLLAQGDAAPDLAQASEIVRRTQELGIAVLVENDTELALSLGADGLHLGDAQEQSYRAARDRLGNAAILGVSCGDNRHAAMTLAEMGADYIAFGGPPLEGERRAELIAWWSEIFQVPCVALHVEDAGEASRLAGLGADFIVPSAKLWLADDPAARLAEIASSIIEARGAALPRRVRAAR